MKKLMVAAILMFGISFGVSAQAKKTEPLKNHLCTASCEKAGKHVYVHGEKGHTCSEACKKSGAATSVKSHVCTDACEKAGKHVYAHGEKGHACSEACKKGKS